MHVRRPECCCASVCASRQSWRGTGNGTRLLALGLAIETGPCMLYMDKLWIDSVDVDIDGIQVHNMTTARQPTVSRKSKKQEAMS
jgi:hypothetical protein